jgi:hypothetical protein
MRSCCSGCWVQWCGCLRLAGCLHVVVVCRCTWRNCVDCRLCCCQLLAYTVIRMGNGDASAIKHGHFARAKSLQLQAAEAARPPCRKHGMPCAATRESPGIASVCREQQQGMVAALQIQDMGAWCCAPAAWHVVFSCKEAWLPPVLGETVAAAACCSIADWHHDWHHDHLHLPACICGSCVWCCNVRYTGAASTG